VVQDDAESDVVRRAAAARLAAIAAATADDGTPLVPVADPSMWWGVHDWTPGVQPIRDPDQPLPLSGSAVAGYETCPLRWFLDRQVHAGGAASVAQGFGTVVHALAQLVAEGTLPPDADVLVAQLEQVWSALGFEAPWQAEREREEARLALRRLVRWLDGRDRRGVASEASFEVAVPTTVGTVVLRGAVDRLEVDADGLVHVVDFKTGRSAKTKAAAEEDPQLAVYQLAMRAGAFADHVPTDVRSGGAELVYLRTEMKSGLPSVRTQSALPDGDHTWADELLDRTAVGMRAERFPARINDGCGMCAFRAVCPAQDAGDQVVR
jgi:RecB family exonuclease